MSKQRKFSQKSQNSFQNFFQNYNNPSLRFVQISVHF